MTQEEKLLLFKDLCARLPYGVICQLSYKTTSITEKLGLGGLGHFIVGDMAVKPYLRPMSSMTEEEEDEYMIARQKDIAEAYIHTTPQNAIDWLNSHHFDYRGLIEKGLALEAPYGMYKTE